MTISVVIPTYNAENSIVSLLTMLEKQTVQPCEILVVDSSSEDDTLTFAEGFDNIKVTIIPKSEFNHGKTRDFGVSLTKGELVLFLTQDAIPENNRMIENLMAPLLANQRIAVAYARQRPRKDSSPQEKLIREFNYPDHCAVHSAEDIPYLGIRTFFCSNACAMYRRDIYEKLGGFEKDLLSNEDMIYAAKAIQSGYQVAYAANACIIHSHDLTLGEQFERNRIQGYEISRHRSLLGENSSSKEGLHMLKAVSWQLLKQGKILNIFLLFADCLARYLGNRTGSKQYYKEITTRMITHDITVSQIPCDDPGRQKTNQG